MVTHNRTKSLGFGAHPANSSDPAVVPEWMTEAWKHRVEAEARHRLKREIRGISSRR